MLSTLIVMPVVLLAIALAFQVGLVLHARSVVEAAAQDGVRAAQRSGGSAAAATAAADQLAGQFASRGLVSVASTSVSNPGANVRVVVAGNALSLVPGFPTGVQGVAEGPVEVFIPERDRP